MDISQVKASGDVPFSWDKTYADTDTDEFSVFLDKEDTRSDPVRDTRSSDIDDRYDPDDHQENDDISESDRDRPEEKERNQSADSSNPAQPSSTVEQNVAQLLLADTAKATTSPVNTGSEETVVAAGAQNSSPSAPNNAVKPTTVQTNSPTDAAHEKNGIQAQATTADPNKASIATDPIQASMKVDAPKIENAPAKGATGLADQTSPTTSTVKTAANQQVENPLAAQKAGETQQGTTTTNSAAETKALSPSAKPTEISQIAATSAEVVEIQAIATKTNQATQGSALETLRADETASMSEKDVLSTKISEMLRDTKGKISITASSHKGAASNSLSLLSDQMTVDSKSASVSTQMASTTAIGTVTQATQQAEIPFSLQPPINMQAPVAQQAAVDPSASGNSAIQGAAIPGVETSSANSASQANMATRVSTQAGSPAEQVSTQMTAAIKEGADKIKIQLHPADLGRVDIQLELSHDGRVMAVISADKQDSLDLLKQDAKLLEQALKDAGFETGSDSLNFSLNQQKEQNEGFQTANSNTNLMGDEMAEETPSPLPLQAYAQSSTSNLDIQV